MGEKWLRELSGREVVKGVEWGRVVKELSEWLRELSGREVVKGVEWERSG